MTMPSLSELLSAFGDGVRGRVEPDADTRRGAIYDHWAGAGALLFAREASRDRDLFRAVHFDTASGRELAMIGRRRFGVEPVAASFGRGTSTLVRDSAAAGEGTVFAGTRVSALRRSQSPATYAVSNDVPVAANATRIDVPIRAIAKGQGVALRAVVDGETPLRVDDALWDSSWRVTTLTCADGTDAEDPAAYRARARQTQLDRRKGYAKAMTDACVAAGAVHVALFASGYAGDDYDVGLNYAYVGDASYAGSDLLVRRCSVALERYRVLGADLQVLPMKRSPVRVRLLARLWDDPAAFNTQAISDAVAASLAGYFAERTTAYGFALDAMAGAALAASDALQDLEFLEPASSATPFDLSTGVARFPAALPRYTLAPSDVTIQFEPPSA